MYDVQKILCTIMSLLWYTNRDCVSQLIHKNQSFTISTSFLNIYRAGIEPLAKRTTSKTLFFSRIRRFLIAVTLGIFDSAIKRVAVKAGILNKVSTI